jgi:hypothetical protein
MDDQLNETFHIYIVLDTTGSMGSCIEALSTALRQIYVMVKILFPKRKFGIHLFTYLDYSDPIVTANCIDESFEDLATFTAKLEAFGGGGTAFSIIIYIYIAVFN